MALWTSTYTFFMNLNYYVLYKHKVVRLTNSICFTPYENKYWRTHLKVMAKMAWTFIVIKIKTNKCSLSTQSGWGRRWCMQTYMWRCKQERGRSLCKWTHMKALCIVTCNQAKLWSRNDIPSFLSHSDRVYAGNRDWVHASLLVSCWVVWERVQSASHVTPTTPQHPEVSKSSQSKHHQRLTFSI